MDNDRIKKAAEFHKQGMNCAQAVACAYCDVFGVDEKTVFRLAEGFGAGMGIQSVCGALTGLFMLIGLKNSSGSTENLTKATTYKLTKEAAEKFKNKNGSIICAELKGLNGKPLLRTCDGCIEDACLLAEEFLALEKI
ncbi:MAG: C-GCAxxG-C-C family protein [Candidatus Gastranaerophilales bacterium]|nr:C-GCAxxG-C-C family protein [Candidatus Gastranaerophilales bacterium]